MMSGRPCRRRGALLLTTLVIAIGPLGCRTATAQPPISPRVEPAPVGEKEGLAALNLVIRRDLEAANAAMTATFNRGDYLGAARFYTDDAQIIGPDNVRVTGRAAIDRYWTSIPAGATWKLEVLDAGGSHASPWQLGRSTLVTPGREAGATHTSIVDFVAIWRRQPDRSLKLYIDMYVPAPRPSAGR
ncbi:MAG: nuclear transport factor 2 family protein [Gemmatimonadaceae bacterium]